MSLNPIWYTTDHGFVVQGLSPGNTTMFLSTNGANSGIINRTQAMYIMPSFDCVLQAANNASNGGVNTILSLYNFDGTVLIGTGNTINAFATIGALVAGEVYMINIAFGAAIALTNTYFTELRFQQTLYVTDFFLGGLEISPSLPSGVTVSTQLYGNRYFNFGGFAVTAGQQYTLCFADVALQNGTLNVALSNFGATNIFTAYNQSFVSNNSLIVVMQANVTGVCPANSQVQVSIATAGTTVTQTIAPIFNSAMFNVLPQQQQALAAIQARIASTQSLRQRTIMPQIMPPPLPTINNNNIMIMSESEDEDLPPRKHTRLY